MLLLVRLASFGDVTYIFGSPFFAQTFLASIADFKEHLEVREAWFGAFEVGVRNANLTSFSSGALGVQQTDDVSGTPKEASVLADSSFLRLDTLADTMTPVDRLLYHDHFVLPALRLKCLQLTEFFKLTYTRWWWFKCLHGTQLLEMASPACTESTMLTHDCYTH